MLNIVGADTSGTENGKIILRFLSEDKKRYDLSLSLESARQALGALMHASSLLPRNPSNQVDGVRLESAEVTAAIGPDVGPALLVTSGPLSIAIPLTAPQLASLGADMSQLANDLSRPKH